MNIKKNLIYFVNLYLSLFNKRDPSLFVFGSWLGDEFSDNPMYLYLNFVQRDKEAYWITKNQNIYRELKNRTLPVCLTGTEEAKKICSKAKYAVFSTGGFDFDVDNAYLGNATFINLWHGIPIKKIGHDDIISENKVSIASRVWNFFDYYPHRKQYNFSTSDKVSEIFMSAFRCKKKYIIPIGQIRNDCFFDGSLQKKQYGYCSYDKLIVYMPTHRKEGKTVMDITKIFDLKRLNMFCSEYRALFMIKKHPYHRNEKSDTSEYNYIIDYTDQNVDTQELLFNTDILITDYSGCYIDYLLLDKPVIFYCFDYMNYLSQDRELYFKYEKITPGPKVQDFNNLLKYLQKIIKGNDEYSSERMGVKNIFYSRDNQNVVFDRLISAIEKL